MTAHPGEPSYGAFVISLDFELHWGLRDSTAVDGPYRANLLGARVAVPKMLSIFDEYDVAATWATVGFLFARSRQDLEEFSPVVRPAYRNPALDAYQETVGRDEADDPLHFAPSLIDQIQQYPKQELATHTFSHYYCQEEGQTEDDFRADLTAAARIAARSGVTLRSIVFPRNQYASQYASVLREHGIVAYRGTERHWMYQGESTRKQRTPWRRGARIFDNYLNLSGPNTTPWSQVRQPDGLYNVPSSRFLRPYSSRFSTFEPMRLQRILRAMEHAARTHQIFHLNWHPHNFGVNLDENLQFLRDILDCYMRLERRYGMRTLSMAEVVDTLTPKPTSPEPRGESICKPTPVNT